MPVRLHDRRGTTADRIDSARTLLVVGRQLEIVPTRVCRTQDENVDDWRAIEGGDDRKRLALMTCIARPAERRSSGCSAELCSPGKPSDITTQPSRVRYAYSFCRSSSAAGNRRPVSAMRLDPATARPTHLAGSFAAYRRQQCLPLRLHRPAG
jgi:hypothetical protein